MHSSDFSDGTLLKNLELCPEHTSRRQDSAQLRTVELIVVRSWLVVASGAFARNPDAGSPAQFPRILSATGRPFRDVVKQHPGKQGVGRI
jgi:hypothetical protein